MKRKFNENQFLASVKRMNTIVPFRGGERNAKDFIAHTLRRCGYNTSDAFHYFKSFIDEYVPEVKNKRFDVAGWKKIYTHHIEKRPLSKFTEHLKIGLSMAETEDDFEYCFTAAANSAGYKGDLLLFEIKLDSIGWESIVKTLVQVADEKGIEVPALPVVEKKSRDGRKKTETPKVVKPATPVVKVEEIKVVEEVEDVKKETKTKRRYCIPIVQLTMDGKPVETFGNTMDAERKTGINHSNITACMKGRVKSAGGFVWRYRDEVSVSEVSEPVVPAMVEEPASIVEETYATPDVEKGKLDTSHKSVKGIVVAYYTDKDKRIDRSLPPIGTYNSQQEAADKLGMSKATISNYFRGVKSSVRWTRDDGVKFWIGLEKCAA